MRDRSIRSLLDLIRDAVDYHHEQKKTEPRTNYSTHYSMGMTENTEQDWIERARQGEPAAVAELYRRYWRAARAAACGVMGDFSLAEDAASEAFYAALDGLQGLKDTQQFGPWLHTIVVRTARRRKTTKSKDSGLDAEEGDPEGIADANEPRKEIERCSSALLEMSGTAGAASS